MRTEAEHARFWRHVLKTETCWWWIGATDSRGYGKVRRGGVGFQAHRLAWIDANGPIPDGLQVCHHCDNRRCVRPDHLFLGTQRDNLLDMVAKGRHGQWVHPDSYRGHKHPPESVPRGEQNKRAKLTADAIRSIRAAYATGTTSQQAIADQYGVRQVTISAIVRRVAWAHVA